MAFAAAILTAATLAAATPDASVSPAARSAAPSLDASTVVSTPSRRTWPTYTVASTPTPEPFPSPAFGHVVYRASRAGSYESLGFPVIACRHRDPGPRTIRVEFFDHLNKRVSVFGPDTLPNVPPGKKVLFASEGSHYKNRDVVIVHVGHFVNGTARVVSDARIIHCMARMRFNPGPLTPTYWRSMGLYREGTGATPVPLDW